MCSIFGSIFGACSEALTRRLAAGRSRNVSCEYIETLCSDYNDDAPIGGVEVERDELNRNPTIKTTVFRGLALSM